MNEPKASLAEILRGRVIRGLRAGTIEPGARLPSARELVGEFRTDYRIILAAYRELATEGLVEIRERGGVYVSRSPEHDAIQPDLPVAWFVDAFTEAFAREIAAPDLSEWLRRSVDTLRLRAVVISSTEDQVVGLARELREDFGLSADGIVGTTLNETTVLPTVFSRADVIVATRAHLDLASRIAAQLDKPVIGIDVRPDLVAGEWAMLLRQPVWAIVASKEFGDMLRAFFSGVRGAENLHVLVHGRDDLSVIPNGAPTYVTGRVREALGKQAIKGRILPAARTIAVESARAIFDFVVRANLRAFRAVNRQDTEPRRA